MGILRGDDALDVLDELFDSLISLAMGLEAIDLDDLIPRVDHINVRLALLAAREFKANMEPVLDFRKLESEREGLRKKAHDLHKPLDECICTWGIDGWNDGTCPLHPKYGVN